MFGKKKPIIQLEGSDPSISIMTIPDIFYGGKDPEIYHTKIEDGLNTNRQTYLASLKKQTNSDVRGSFLSRKRTWIIGGVAFVIIMGGVSTYYFMQFKKSQQQIVQKDTPAVTNSTKNQVETSTTTEVVVVTTTDNNIEQPTSTIPIDPFIINFPPLLTLNTADLDADELTDIEEGLFNTDSGTWDTDTDAYYDGQEILNLYNPKGFAPVKLIDSGLVKEYINTQGYRIYYPFSWQFGEVDVEQTQVLFSGISGEYIEVRVFKKESGDNFFTWFGKHAKGQQYTDLVEFTNRFKEKGWRRSDHLVSYFENDSSVFAIMYHQKDLAPVPYRSVMRMMYQSFRPQKTDIEIPEQQAFMPSTNTLSDIVPSSSTNTTALNDVQ